MYVRWNRSQVLSLIIGAGLGLTMISCSDGGAPVTSGSSSFSSYLAEDLVVSSPTATRSVSSLSSLAMVENDLGAFAIPSGDAPADQKVDALESLIATSPTSCAISITLSTAGNATCYGPSVNYTGHEFDASNGSWPGGDLGIWEANQGSDQSCSAAQLNSRISGAASLADLGSFVAAGLICVANLNSLSPPSASASLDLTSYMSGLVTVDSSALTVSSASLAREADDSSGNPVRVATLVGTSGNKTYTIRVKHVSLDTSDTTYRGKVSVKIANADGTKPGNCSSGSETGQVDAVSVAYQKTSSTSATYELKSANFCGSSADPFVSSTNHSVDLSKTFNSTTRPTGWANNGNYLSASFDPATIAGTFTFAWQAGVGDSHARTFNAKISGSGSTLAGTTYFGFGPTLSASPGSIDGMICAWTGPDTTHTPVTKVQRQVIGINTSTGKFTNTSSNITYDPVADCDAAGGMSMSWNGGASTRAVNATTEDLVSVTEVTTTIGTLPSSPTDVD